MDGSRKRHSSDKQHRQHDEGERGCEVDSLHLSRKWFCYNLKKSTFITYEWRHYELCNVSWSAAAEILRNITHCVTKDLVIINLIRCVLNCRKLRACTVFRHRHTGSNTFVIDPVSLAHPVKLAARISILQNSLSVSIYGLLPQYPNPHVDPDHPFQPNVKASQFCFQ